MVIGHFRHKRFCYNIRYNIMDFYETRILAVIHIIVPDYNIYYYYGSY